MSRLALGTAQFGQSYGIANRGGQVSRSEAGRILAHGARAGIDTLDTAAAYADSEVWLGEFGMDTWKVITKIPTLPSICDDVSGWVRHSAEISLSRLRIRRAYGILLHNPSDLVGPHGSELYAGLIALRNDSKVDRIGVSVYEPVEVDSLMDRFQLDIVQAPFNVLDRRMATSGMLQKMVARGIEFHSRSTFLQGLLLMDPATRPTYFDRWDAVFRQWDEWLVENKVSGSQACLRSVLSNPGIAKIVVGADREAQLEEIVAASSQLAAVPPLSLASEDIDLLNPSRWPKQ